MSRRLAGQGRLRRRGGVVRCVALLVTVLLLHACALTVGFGDYGTDPPPCGAGEKICDGRCVARSDPSFGCTASECSRCASDGRTTLACREGACIEAGCVPGYKSCGGHCVAVSDPTYGCSVSGCDPNCPEAAGGRLVCNGNTCARAACPEGTKGCNGACEPQDPSHGCKQATCTACPGTATGAANCDSAGACAFDCARESKVCGDRCVAWSDPAYGCGATGCSACPTPAVGDSGYAFCFDKECALESVCERGTKSCLGSCIPVDEPCARSCRGLAKVCGALGKDDCCASTVIPAGSFGFGRNSSGPENDVCSTWGDCSAVDGIVEVPEVPATISAFVLDTFEVTVGRFRSFVKAYPSNRPIGGAGAHPRIPNSGWTTFWDGLLPATSADLVARISSCELHTWTDVPTESETRPINCVDFFTAFAFCAWDAARLPTEAEWEYAATGGEERPLPWSVSADSPPDIVHANFECLYSSGTACADLTSIAAVGSFPAGAGRWGQLDLVGNVAEWTRDFRSSTRPTSCVDCAQFGGTQPVIRGQSYASLRSDLRASDRDTFRYEMRDFSDKVGFRCARDMLGSRNR